MSAKPDQRLPHATDRIKTQLNEARKEYFEYDGSNRLSKVYEAPIDAVNGDVCLVTEYAYDGVSLRIQKGKEYLGTWSSSYDI